MNSIIKLGKWVSHHPFKSSILTFLVAIVGAMWATQSISTKFLLAVSVTGIVVAVVVIHFDLKKIVTLLLISGLLGVVPVKAEVKKADNAAVVFAIVIIVVGGVVSCKLVKFCQKAFPPPPPPPPPPPATNNTSGSFSGIMSVDDDDGAASYSTSGFVYCWEESWPADSDPECDDCNVETNDSSGLAFVSTALWPTPLSLNDYIGPDWASDDIGQIPTNVVGLDLWAIAVLPRTYAEPLKTMLYPPQLSSRNEDGILHMLSGREFYNYLLSNGITVSTTGNGGAYYARNGIPCSPEDCPIEFIPDPTRPSVLPNVVIKSLHPGRYQVAIQRSEDLKVWYTVFVATVPGNKAFHFNYASQRSKVYFRTKLVN